MRELCDAKIILHKRQLHAWVPVDIDMCQGMLQARAVLQQTAVSGGMWLAT